MDVVLYMRYSSDRQTEQSIEGQQRVCMEFCKRSGYNVVGKYVDRATSAFKDTEKRTEFNRMIKDSDKQMWQGVVVYKLDRFARNRYDSATYKARLKKNGIKVISATENISDNPEGVILEAVLEGMAEFYSKELSQKISRGMRESAYKCHSIGGHIPLGYKIVEKKLVIDEPNAQIVREAFDLYANGATVAEICEKFNNQGYRTAKGAKFNKNSFKSMFRNEKYVGVYTYKEIRIEDGVPAIVDKNTFDIVQKRLKKNGEAPSRGKAKVDYILAQKLFCGHCGATMVGDSGTSRTGEVHNYYTCSNRKRFHSCDKKSIRKEVIERIVAEDAFALFTPERIEWIADMAIKGNQEDLENDEVIPALRAEIKELDKGISNLLKLVERGAESDTLATRLTDLEKQKRDAERRLMVAEDDYIILDRDLIIRWLSQFLDGDIEDEEFRRQIIDLLVNSVTVWDEPDGYYRITAVYNLTDERTKSFRIKVEERSDLRSQLPPRKIPTSLEMTRFAGIFLILPYSAKLRKIPSVTDGVTAYSPLTFSRILPIRSLT